MKLIADRQLHSAEYGTVIAGQEFEVSDDAGAELLKSGLAHKAGPPRILYETKVIIPDAPEVKPGSAQPFRNLPDPHEKSPALAALRNAVREVSEVPDEGAADSEQRGGRVGRSK